MPRLFVFLAAVLWAGNSFAASAVPEENKTEYNVFGVPQQVIRTIKASAETDTQPASVVDCGDKELWRLVRDKLSELQTEVMDENVIDRRRRLLALKHIGDFSPLPVEAFQPKDNYRVANRMIYVKINHGLKDKDLQLCAGDNSVLSRRVYLLAYPLRGQTIVEIINYTATIGEGEPFIVYDKKNLAKTGGK